MDADKVAEVKHELIRDVVAFVRDIGFPIAVAAYLLYMANDLLKEALANQVKVSEQLILVNRALDTMTTNQAEILRLLRVQDNFHQQEAIERGNRK